MEAFPQNLLESPEGKKWVLPPLWPRAVEVTVTRESLSFLGGKCERWRVKVLTQREQGDATR